jgi:hypothetical protein
MPQFQKFIFEYFNSEEAKHFNELNIILRQWIEISNIGFIWIDKDLKQKLRHCIVKPRFINSCFRFLVT